MDPEALKQLRDENQRLLVDVDRFRSIQNELQTSLTTSQAHLELKNTEVAALQTELQKVKEAATNAISTFEESRKLEVDRDLSAEERLKAAKAQVRDLQKALSAVEEANGKLVKQVSELEDTALEAYQGGFDNAVGQVGLLSSDLDLTRRVQTFNILNALLFSSILLPFFFHSSFILHYRAPTMSAPSYSSSLEVSDFPFLSSSDRESKLADYRQWVDEEVWLQASFYLSPLVSHYVSEKTWCEAAYADHFQAIACHPIDRVCHPPFHGERDFIYVYEPVFRLLGVTFPFQHFEAEVLWALGLAPLQLHPDSWAVIQAFRLVCRSYGVVPTAALLLYFYYSDVPAPTSWVRLIPRTGRDLFSEYNISPPAFRPWFFKVYASERRLFATTTRSFPLH
ncbi:hypothetical protein CR513_32906, partial [Mucuna pruriens]